MIWKRWDSFIYDMPIFSIYESMFDFRGVCKRWHPPLTPAFGKEIHGLVASPITKTFSKRVLKVWPAASWLSRGEIGGNHVGGASHRKFPFGGPGLREKKHLQPMIPLMEEIRLTTQHVWNPVNNRINYLSSGAGFLPSTVCWWHLKSYTELGRIMQSEVYIFTRCFCWSKYYLVVQDSFV